MDPLNLRVSFVVALGLCAALSTTDLNAESGTEPPAPVTTPTSVTPSDVFATVELLNRSLDVVLQAKGIEQPASPKSTETKLGPFHVYQLLVASAERLHDYQEQAGFTPLPLIVSRPRTYTPADVMRLTEMLLRDVERNASREGVLAVPSDRTAHADKTPTDVFHEAVATFIKLCALNGQRAITPNEVYAELVRGVSDAQSILAQIDPACRYRIDAPASADDLKPSDVYAQCLQIRRRINIKREELQLGTTPLPQVPADRKLAPTDVFIQTQIILAELNMLKKGTRTVSSTPLAIPVTGKTPKDAHQKAALVEYLVTQIGTDGASGNRVSMKTD